MFRQQLWNWDALWWHAAPSLVNSWHCYSWEKCTASVSVHSLLTRKCHAGCLHGTAVKHDTWHPFAWWCGGGAMMPGSVLVDDIWVTRRKIPAMSNSIWWSNHQLQIPQSTTTYFVCLACTLVNSHTSNLFSYLCTSHSSVNPSIHQPKTCLPNILHENIICVIDIFFSIEIVKINVIHVYDLILSIWHVHIWYVHILTDKIILYIYIYRYEN